jgi:hypothetical protein
MVLFSAGELAKEFFGRLGLLSFRFPPELIEVNAATVIDTNAFPDEETFLLLETPPLFKGDSAPAVDDPVPGKAVLSRGGMEDPDDLACGPVIPGEGGDLSIGNHLTAGNRFDDGLDLLLEFHPNLPENPSRIMRRRQHQMNLER